MSHLAAIEFIPFTNEHLFLWRQWIQLPHVKNTWFLEGYESSENIIQKVRGNGYDYPYVIKIDGKPVGYIQSCDLYAYKTQNQNPKGLFTNEDPGTWCMDLFIADTDYLNKGYGTIIVKRFIEKLFHEHHAKKILIDPAESNHRAIRCYEKAGFTLVRHAHDGVTDCVIMAIEQ